jgi:Zn-dependent membrane protease YugP
MRKRKSNHLGHRSSWINRGRFGRDSYLIIFILLLLISLPISLVLGLIILSGMFVFALMSESKEYKRREKEIEDEE